ncbi:MAG: apolipoprotein N-acyltransferase [Flavobacteriales bacterium]|nr:apolipoprotein N-acyltransferase [Flavobacteriales bacterium]
MQRKLVLSVLSGVLFGLSWPTYGFPLLIFIAFVPLLLIEQHIIINKEKYSYLKVFSYSYLSFFIWNLIVIHWLYFAKRPDGSYAVEALIFPVLANSLLMSITFLCYHFVKKSAGSYFGLVFLPCVWIAFETFHLDWECTFPWLNLGNVFADYHKWIQWYEFTGVFGGSLWIILVNILIFYNYRAYQASRKRIYIKRLVTYTSLFIIIPISISLIQYNTYEEKGEKIEVVVVQPELDPYTEKYTKSSKDITAELLQLADNKITENTKYVVAPETAFPGTGSLLYDSRESNYLINMIRDWLSSKKNKDLAFVSGTEFHSVFSENNKPNRESVFYNPYTRNYEEHFNSAVEVTKNDTLEVYHKSKLVVGVEKIPFAGLFSEYFAGLAKIFDGTMHSLGTQKEREVFENGGIKVAPIICYESIYGEFVTDYVKKGAQALFIMTNDSWWEDSQGYKQLLVYAKLRAIESRRSIARSANSGVSCFINQKGDILEHLDFMEQGSLRGEIQLNNEKTVYTKYGDYISRILMFLLGIILAYALSQKILIKSKKSL